VLAGLPGADGIVGDLGGGSLELVRVRPDGPGERASFPLGVLRIQGLAGRGDELEHAVARMLAGAGWDAAEGGLPFYMVGGSWRAMARLDMYLTGYPLPIVHAYRMAPDRPSELLRRLAVLDRKALKAMPGVPAGRLPTLADATALVSILARRLQSTALVTSAFGLREGLLYAAQTPAARAADPLIAAVRAEGQRSGRFAEHGDLLDRWIAPLFDATAPDGRLRLATCLLADIGWRAHPDFRAERALDVALHGNWVGVDARGRAMIAHALFVSFGGDGIDPVPAALASPADLACAARWGLAIRLGQRLGAGTATVLEGSSIARRGDKLVLSVAPAMKGLLGEIVERRLAALAAAFGLVPELAA
jgi:exopolyphosphatase / guanosine-5'-triphosphate,3'-diphosphate pyrophosphatase